MANAVFDAVIVGAGIVGAACAQELAAAGLRVLICDGHDHVGGGATAAGMGHLAVMDDSDAQFALTSYSQQLWHELAPQLPADAEYLPCGSLWVASDEEEWAEVLRKYDFYRRRGVPVEMLESAELARAEPNLRPGLAGALRMGADSVCYPPCAARYLIECAMAAGGELRLDTRVLQVNDDGVFTADRERIAAALVVVAAGTEVSRLFPELGVAPRKGHLLITDRYPGFLRHQLIELGYLKSAHTVASDSVAFNAQPRLTGQILLGSSRQFGAEDPAIEDHMLQRMLRRALEFMPALSQLTGIRSWTGFRAATPDKLPLIGLAPGFHRVYLAAGHEGLGISTSLATARLIADDIFDRPSQIAREPYRADRSIAVHV